MASSTHGNFQNTVENLEFFSQAKCRLCHIIYVVYNVVKFYKFILCLLLLKWFPGVEFFSSKSLIVLPFSKI